MLQLIKQVLKSFKSSFLILIGLIVISSIIVFGVFSSIFFTVNSIDSISYISKEGNESNAILDLKKIKNGVEYIDSDPATQGQPKPIFVADKKTILTDPDTNAPYPDGVPLIVYNKTQSSFNDPKVNSDPFNYRDYEILKAYGVDKDGNANPININNQSTWMSFSAGFKLDGKNANDPTTTNFDSIVYYPISPTNKNGEKPISFSSYYYNGKFDDFLPHVSGTVVPIGNETWTKKPNSLSRVKKFKGIDSNLGFLEPNFLETSLPISETMNIEMIKNTFYKDFVEYLISNTISEDHPVYSYKINFIDNSVEKNIYIYLKEKYKELPTNSNLEEKQKFEHVNSMLKRFESIEFPIKDMWINGDNNLKEKIIKYSIDIASKNASNFLYKYYDEYILHKLNQYSKENDVSINSSFQSQFSVTDSDSLSNFVVSRKENTTIDKIVYSSGSTLSTTINKYNKNNLFILEPHINESNEIKKYFKNYIYFLKDSLLMDSEKPKYIQDALDDLTYSFDQHIPVNDGYYKLILAYFYIGDLMNSPWSLINENMQGISINFKKFGYGITEMFIQKNVISPDINSYTAIVNEKYLQLNNKKIFPINEWNIVRKKNPIDFYKWIKTVDKKYKISINSRELLIIGTGISPEIPYPTYSIESLFPNPKDTGIVYVNNIGYNSILLSSPYAMIYEFFSLSFLKSDLSKMAYFEINRLIDNLNIYFNDLFGMGDEKQNFVYSLNNLVGVKNILTIRKNIPTLMTTIISVISYVILIILILIGMYLSYLLIKDFISKNQVELAIIKSNGFSSFSISIAISLFGIISGFIAAIIGYLLGHFLQPIFYGIISYYWFLPIEFMPFSYWMLFSGMGILFVLFILYTFIIVKKIFKKPINELISSNVEIKQSIATNVIRTPTKGISSLSKLRISLSLSNIWRTIFLSTLCSICLSTISICFALPTKFNQSQVYTSNTKEYKYRFGLNRTNEQTGLYKFQKYSELGISDLSKGIFPIYKANAIDKSIKKLDGTFNQTQPGMYYNGVFYKIGNDLQPTNYPYDLSDLKIIDYKTGEYKKDKNDNYMYLGNMFVPSFNSNSRLNYDPRFFQNVVFSKWLLDFNVPTFEINPWELVKTFIPQEIISRVNSRDQEFLRSIWNHVDENGQPTSINIDSKKYLLYDESKNIYSININNVLNSFNEPAKMGFKKEFLKFMCTVYGDENLSNKDIKLSFSIVPYFDRTDEKIGDEPYSEANVSIYKEKNNDIELINNSITLTGIVKNSNYIKLNNNDNLLNDLLFNDIDEIIDQPSDVLGKYDVVGPFNVIINNGSSFKYNLKENDYFFVKANKGYFYNSYKSLDELGLLDSNKEIKEKIYKFKVVGVNDSSYGNDFFTSQDAANLVNGLYLPQKLKNNNSSINTMLPDVIKNNLDNQYPGYVSNFVYSGATLNKTNPSEVYYEMSASSDNVDYLSPLNSPFPNLNPNFKEIDIENNFRKDKPFNGIFTNSEKPLLLTNSLVFNSVSSIWNFFPFSNITEFTEKMTMIMNRKIWEAFYNCFTTHNQALLDMIDQSKNINSYETLLSYIRSKITDLDNFYILYESVFSNNGLILAMNNIENFESLNEIFSTFLNTTQTINELVLAIIIPIILFMILIISSNMLNEFKKIIVTLKVLGYSDFENVISLLCVFVPILVFSLLLGLLLTFLGLYFIQFIFYKLTSIFLYNSILFIPFLIGFLSLIVIMAINFIFIYILYKKEKMNVAINE